MQCRWDVLELAPGRDWEEDQEDSTQDCSDLDLLDDESTLERCRLI